jgi:hypothetical protein
MCHVLIIEGDYLNTTQIAERVVFKGASSVAFAATQAADAAAFEHKPAVMLARVM